MCTQFLFFVISVCLCLCACGVLMEQSTNTVRVINLIPIGSNDANDACTHSMMNAMAERACSGIS